MFFFLLTSLLLALLIEGTVTTLPLVLVVLLCLTIQRRDAMVFPVAFVVGILLDVFALRTIGMSSLFFTSILFMILLYQRKYEINSYPFVGAAAFLGSIAFFLLFGHGNVLIDSLVAACIAWILFAVSRFSKLRSTNPFGKFRTGHEAGGFRSITHDS